MNPLSFFSFRYDAPIVKGAVQVFSATQCGFLSEAGGGECLLTEASNFVAVVY